MLGKREVGEVRTFQKLAPFRPSPSAQSGVFLRLVSMVTAVPCDRPRLFLAPLGRPVSCGCACILTETRPQCCSGCGTVVGDQGEPQGTPAAGDTSQLLVDCPLLVDRAHHFQTSSIWWALSQILYGYGMIFAKRKKDMFFERYNLDLGRDLFMYSPKGH